MTFQSRSEWIKDGYWEWAKTAPRCEGCGYPFDPANAKQCNSHDSQRFCCGNCSISAKHRLAAPREDQ